MAEVELKPKVSVILPVYNVEAWLPACLDSLKSQTMAEWEAIIVIDGSLDRSEQIARDYAKDDARFKIIVQPNAGQGAARNKGVEASCGEYLLFLDSDDAVPPNALSVLVEKADKTLADVVVGDVFTFNDGALAEFETRTCSDYFKKRFAFLPDVFTRKDLNDFDLFYNSLYFMVVWMKLFRASVWKHNGIMAPAGLSMGEDQITVKHMVLVADKITTVPHTVVYYRRREKSSTTLRSDKAFGIFDSYLFAVKLYRDLDVSVEEMTLLHRAYLASYVFHLQFFVPFASWVRFYKAMCQSVRGWPLSALDMGKFTSRELIRIGQLLMGGKWNFLRLCLNIVMGYTLHRAATMSVGWVKKYFSIEARRRMVACLNTATSIVPGEKNERFILKAKKHFLGE